MATEEKEVFKTDWHFETENDEAMGIETAVYANGNQVKRFGISTGEQVTIRELSGRDMMDIDKMMVADRAKGDAEEKYMCALFHASVKIAGNQLPMEDFEKLKGKDYNRIKIAVQSLNF